MALKHDPSIYFLVFYSLQFRVLIHDMNLRIKLLFWSHLQCVCVSVFSSGMPGPPGSPGLVGPPGPKGQNTIYIKADAYNIQWN